MAQPNSAIYMTVARNAAFMDRIDYWAKKAAIDVMAEVNTTPGHTERLAFAGKILGGTYPLRDLAAGVVTNATIAAGVNLQADDLGVPDDPLLFVVNSLYNAYAGVGT